MSKRPWWTIPKPSKAPSRRSEVLLVATEGFTQDLLAYALDRSGYVVRRARAGREIPGLLRIAPPEVVILDQDLREDPDALGWCRWFRTQDSTRLCPIVLLTSLRLRPVDVAPVKILDVELMSKAEFRLEDLLRKLERMRPQEHVKGAATTVAARFHPCVLGVLPQRLREALEAGHMEVGAIESVARVEPGVAMRLLSLGTSARERPRSIRGCLSAIGTSGLSDILSSVSTEPAADERESNLRRTLGRRALGVAEIAERIARTIRHPEPESMYAAGLLHNLGQQALLAFDADRFFDAWEAGSEGVLLPDAERSRFHFSDAEVLLEIGKRWRLSMEVLIPACSPWIDEHRMGIAQVQRMKGIEIVRLAHRLASAYLVGAMPGDPIESPTAEMLAVLGLDGAAISELASSLMGDVIARVDEVFGAGEAWLPGLPDAPVAFEGHGFDPVRLALARLGIPVASGEDAGSMPILRRRPTGELDIAGAVVREPFAIGTLARALWGSHEERPVTHITPSAGDSER